MIDGGAGLPGSDRSSTPEADRAALEAVSESDFGKIVRPDMAVLLPARGWGHVDRHGFKVLCAEIVSKPLERMVLDNNVEPLNSGVCFEIDNPALDPLCPALWIQLVQFQTFTPLGDNPYGPGCDFDWVAEIRALGFALIIENPDPSDARYLYIATPPVDVEFDEMSDVHIGPQRVGRNDKCACGSGLKFKRCCGA